MKKNLLTFVVLLTSVLGYSQTITAFANTDTTNCNGSASLSSNNTFTSWYWTYDTYSSMQTGGLNVDSLCSGTYYLFGSTSGGGIDTIAFTINDSIQNICSGFLANITVIQSPDGACDGDMLANTSGGTAPYNYSWLNMQTLNNDNLTVPNYNLQCAGQYSLTVTDVNGCSATSNVNLVDSSIVIPPTITATDNTDTTNCNGSATINDTTGLGNWWWIDNSGNNVQINGTSVNNLCGGTYYLYTNTDTVTFNIWDSLPNPCTGFSGVIVENANVNGNCLGILEATTTGGTAPFTYDWSNSLTLPIPTPTTATITNLCDGAYTVIITDVNGCTTIVDYMLFDSSATTTPISMNVYTTNTTSSGACDGTASININGGTPVYVIDGVSTSNGYLFLDSLCAGVYTAIGYDANGDTITFTYLIATDSTTIINNPYTGSGSTAIDTTTNGVLENCVINYQNIDSAGITGVNYAAIDSVIVDYTIYYNNGSSVVITETFTDSFSSGFYVFILDLFCPNKSTNNFLKIYDEIYFDSNMIGTAWQLGLENNNDLNVNIYPIPFKNDLIIELEEINNYTVSIYDISGKIVLSNTFENTDKFNLNVTDLSKGQYIIRIQNETTVITKKIVK